MPLLMLTPPDRIIAVHMKLLALGAAQDLPEVPEKYFLLPPDAVLLPINALVATRARPKGVLNAGNLMRQAYAGQQERRKPISVELWKDSLYLVKDGNSTLVNAYMSGWKAIPCLLLD